MDEPTASLDPLAEQDVLDRFADLSRGKISIFVSHRLSGARLAGQIIVLEDGAIVEEGTHDSLMSAGGMYHQMYQAQKQWYEKE